MELYRHCCAECHRHLLSVVHHPSLPRTAGRWDGLFTEVIYWRSVISPTTVLIYMQYCPSSEYIFTNIAS